MEKNGENKIKKDKKQNSNAMEYHNDNSIKASDIISNDEFVIIPHPLMHLRDFVLKPLNEIAQYALHPLKNKRIFELVDC